MKIAIQAGHAGLTTGVTGAPNEQKWNLSIVPVIANKLTLKGFETYECDALAYKDMNVTGTDWDLFLAVHYDADIYNDRGGFIDTPDQSVDYVSTESQRIAAKMRENYFPKTDIPEKPARSNANTKFYYMWNYLSANTPCVLIECGVGNRSPEDHNTLFNELDKVADAIVDGIVSALMPENATGAILEAYKDKIDALENELQEMRESRNKWRDKYEALDKSSTAEIQSKITHIEELQKTISEQNVQLTTVTANYEAYGTKIEALEKDLEDCGQQKELLQSNLNTLTKERDESQQKLVKAQAEVKRLKDKKYTTKEALSILVASLR
jgi:predicted  nucleic acid-binding Zn-ribbon protein